MRLDRISVAWKVIKSQHGLQVMTDGDILQIIDQTKKMSDYSVLQNVVLFILILLSCQGG